MDLNESVKTSLLDLYDQYQQAKNHVGFGLSHAAGQVSEDLGLANRYLQDPRNAWIGMNPLGKAASTGLGLAAPLLGKVVYHGSPYAFEKFALKHIGRGEGSQAFGHGLYFADKKDIAQFYQKQKIPLDLDLSEHEQTQIMETAQSMVRPSLGTHGWLLWNTNSGYPLSGTGWYKTEGEARKAITNPSPSLKQTLFEEFALPEQLKKAGLVPSLYATDLPDTAINQMLLWDKRISQQPKYIQEQVKKIYDEWPPALHQQLQSTNPLHYDPYGADFYGALSTIEGPERASARLHAMGIPGIRYLDAASRGVPSAEQTFNYVVFDDRLPTILKRETH